MHYRIITKAIAFLLLLIAVDVAFVSCYKSKTYNYKYARALLEVMEADSLAGERYLAIDGDSVKAQKLFMDVYLGSDIIARANVAPSLFIGSAMAMQPNEDYYINKSRLKNINVTTLTKYNNSFPANSDITANCSFGFERTRYSGNLYTATDFVEKFNKHIQANEKIFDAHIPSEMFWFRFKESAQMPGTQQMKITIEMEDGSILESESLRFRLYQ
jgi:hypothetical protein